MCLRLFPIDISTDWTVTHLFQGHRVWKRTVCSTSNLSLKSELYATFGKVKSSAQKILNVLKDYEKQRCWNLYYPPINSIFSFSSVYEPETNKKQQKQNSINFISPCSNSIQITLNNQKKKHSLFKALDDYLSKFFSNKLKFFGENVFTVERCWSKLENNCCWLLEYENEMRSWIFYLMQPREGWFDSDQCIVTIVKNSLPMTVMDDYIQENKFHNIHDTPGVLLCGLKNYLKLKKFNLVQVTKLVNQIQIKPNSYKKITSTQSIHLESDKKSMTGNSLQSSVNIENKIQEKNSTVNDLNDNNIEHKEISIFKRIKNLIEEKKEELEMKRKGSFNSLNNPSVNLISNYLNSTSNPMDNNKSIATSFNNSSPSLNTINNNNINAVGISSIVINGKETNVPLQGPLDLFRLLGPTKNQALKFEEMQDKLSKNATGYSEDEKEDCQSTDDSDETHKISDFVQSKKFLKIGNFKEKKKSGIHSVHYQPGKNDEEETCTFKKESPDDSDDNTVTNNEDLKQQINYFETIIDEVALDIITQKSHVSGLDITANEEQQAIQTDGWIYCGLEKDTVILRKIYENSNSCLSYMGKGIISHSPKLVFDVLKSPKSRLFYDDTIKKMDIVKEINEDIQILHLFYDVCPSSPEESRDFVLLQGRRVEGMKFIITFSSLDWSELPENKDIVRAMFFPSGWVIEPVMKGDKLCSMVTYISQIDLKNAKDPNNRRFIEDIAANQPLSIIQLRQYMTKLYNKNFNSKGASSITKIEHFDNQIDNSINEESSKVDSIDIHDLGASISLLNQTKHESSFEAKKNSVTASISSAIAKFRSNTIVDRFKESHTESRKSSLI